MMRDEEDDDSSSAAASEQNRTRNHHNPLAWTARSVRRVQLAVRTSITSSVVKKAVFENDHNNDNDYDETFTVSSSQTMEENTNIDQAMMGLYCLPDETPLFATTSSSSSLFYDGSIRSELFRRRRSGTSSSRYQPNHSVYDISELTQQQQQQSSSYIPQDDCDPILDGGYRDWEQEQRSQELIDAIYNYEDSLDWKMALELEAENGDTIFRGDNTDNSSNDDDESSSAASHDDDKEETLVDDKPDDDADDDFGDFQSASESHEDYDHANQNHHHGGENAATIKEAVLHTPPPKRQTACSQEPTKDTNSTGSGSTFDTVNTVGLMRRVEGLLVMRDDDDGHGGGGSSLDDNDIYSVLSSDLSSTPALMEQSNTILERAAREERDQKRKNEIKQAATSDDDDDDDSDATPTTKGHSSYSTPSRQLWKDLREIKKISMDLPLNNLTTLEEKWTRRRQNECSTAAATLEQPQSELELEASLDSVAELVSDLPELYRVSLERIDDGPIEANATISKVLNAVPWGCVHFDNEVDTPLGGNDLLVWDDFMSAQLSQLDSTLEGVQKIMATSVKPEKLEVANNLVHSCEQNLRLARIYWDRSSQALKDAVAADSDGNFNGVGALGPAYLLDWWKQKEDFVQLQAVLERLDDITAREKEITRRIDTFDATHSRAEDEYHEVVRLGKELRDTLNGDLAKLGCLSELRDSRLTSILEERFWSRLKCLTQENVVRVCRQRETPSLEYESLIKAAIGLFEASQTRRDISAAEAPSGSAAETFDQITGWSDCIFETLSYEAERCLAVSLLEPYDVQDSSFVKDLRSLEQKIDSDRGDTAKLKSLTHNLVTIRFEFERDLNYLPSVILHLCESLLEILRAHFLFMQLHCNSTANSSSTENELFADPVASDIIKSVADGLRGARTLIWEKCESVITHALQEYLNFAPKSKMFSSEGVRIDDSAWQQELQGLHTVYSALRRFLQFKPAFFENDMSAEDCTSERGCPLWEAFDELSVLHLRSVHVEAMTCMGRMLSRETWYLVSCGNAEEEKSDPSDSSPSSKHIISASMASAINRHKGLSMFYFFDDGDSVDRFPVSASDEGSFLSLPRPASISKPLHGLSADMAEVGDDYGSVYESVDVVIESSSETLPRIATQTIVEGLVEWVARLVLVSAKIPRITEQVCAAMENVFDLYFTTVFRLCSGSRRNERILLGEDLSTSNGDVSSSPPRGRSSSPLISRPFGHERRSIGKPPSAPFRTSVTISSTLDIELCSPTPKEFADVARVRRFIDRAQQELHGNVNLNRVDSWIGNSGVQDDPEEYACAVAKSIERREAAAWSCLVVAGLAGVALSTMQTALPSGTDLGRFETYVHEACGVVGLLARKSSEVSCARALSSFGFVKEIVQVGAEWEESKLHEQPNDYVESLCERACLIWGFVAASGKLPSYLEAQVWARLQMASYLTLLEGFSRVIYCSTEGRALMALDLASISSNFQRGSVHERLETFDLPFTPPAVSPRYGKHYVDLYVKVYYYPQEDVLNWIANNVQDYKLHHMLSLVSSSGFRGQGDQSQKIYERVKNFYSTARVT